jgi:hypothetical protein
MVKTESTAHLAAKPETAKMAVMGETVRLEAEVMVELAAMVAIAPQAKAVRVVMEEMQTNLDLTGDKRIDLPWPKLRCMQRCASSWWTLRGRRPGRA